MLESAPRPWSLSRKYSSQQNWTSSVVDWPKTFQTSLSSNWVSPRLIISLYQIDIKIRFYSLFILLIKNEQWSNMNNLYRDVLSRGRQWLQRSVQVLVHRPGQDGRQVHHPPEELTAQSPRMGRHRQDWRTISVPETSRPPSPLCGWMQMSVVLRAEDHGGGGEAGHLQGRLRKVILRTFLYNTGVCSTIIM